MYVYYRTFTAFFKKSCALVFHARFPDVAKREKSHKKYCLLSTFIIKCSDTSDKVRLGFAKFQIPNLIAM